jgi:hypothetical protein
MEDNQKIIEKSVEEVKIPTKPFGKVNRLSEL